jgi:hypothetical protein
MAIRSIANQEKHVEEKKSRTHKESSDKASNTAIKESQAAKMKSDAHDTTTFTEVFDSSKYESMAEMKKLADIQEEPAITEVQTSNVNVNSSHITTTVADTSLPNLEEKAAELRNSKPDMVEDKKEEAETWPTHGLANPYTLFSNAVKSWTDLYVESARSVTEITRYWLDLFYSPDLKKTG